MTVSQNANATIAVALGIPVALVIGGILGGAGLVTGWFGIGQISDGVPVPTLVGVIMALVGVIVMDGAEGQTIAFQTVSLENAKALQLSDAEMNSYNNEIDEINNVKEMVGRDLAQLQKPGLGDSTKLWAKYSSSLSPESFSAVQKIAAQFIKNAK